MFSVEHASSMGPAVMEEGGNRQASYLVAKQRRRQGRRQDFSKGVQFAEILLTTPTF